MTHERRGRTGSGGGDDVPAARAPERPAEDGAGERGALSRRAFLAAAGFSTAGALAACRRAPVRHVVSWTQQPPELTPGKAVWYAGTCQACPAGCGVLVKCRDGRPIKVEGHPEHPLSRGGLCAVGQSAILSLYDERRCLGPRKAGAEATWEEADRAVREGLEAAREAGGKVVLLTGTLTSPTTRRMIAAFLGSLPRAEHVVVDALSASALLEAHERAFGVRALPRVRLERAREILAVEADFLGTWIAPVPFTRGWREGRGPTGTPPRMSHHVQAEASLSLTGSNADRRWRIEAGDAPALLAHLAFRLARRAGRAGAPRPEGAPPVPDAELDAEVARLWAARGESVVLCGADDVDAQVLAAHANDLLGAYAAILDLEAPSFQRQGDDRALARLVQEMERGEVAALVVAGANPVADAPGGSRFAKAAASVALRVALAEREDETTRALTWVLPAPHPLEAWEDGEPVAGLLNLSQPAIRPFGQPRTLRECLAAWSGQPRADVEILREAWAEHAHPRQQAEADAARSWERAVHDAFAVVEPATSTRPRPFDVAALPAAAPAPRGPAAGRLALLLFPSVGIPDGRHAHNPWLQELPDPVTKLTWGNAALVSESLARERGLAEGDVVRIARADDPAASVQIPVLVQPGMADRTVAIATGFGRQGTERFADVGPRWLEGRPTVAPGGRVGTSAAPLLRWRDGGRETAGAEVVLEATGRREDLARSQTWHSLDLPARTAPRGHERRDAVRETTLGALARRPGAGATAHAAGGHGAGAHGGDVDLWKVDQGLAGGHRWGMAIDLSACTGCSACVVACQSENNVPVVGKDEVLRRRDMHWMRIDRYYAKAPGDAGGVEVAHQPMLCQHCDNAPCETVCPVLATVHTSEGLNAQVYNRCVGTRYCANNCPYKVRRFNWFEYDRGGPRAELALNPDVTVRSRGVMEKCSFCVQRIQEARVEARRQGRAVADGEIRTACQQSCPAGAIVFGDLNDPESAVSKRAAEGRHYHVLEELNVRPSIGYLAKVRNREAAAAPGDRHG